MTKGRLEAFSDGVFAIIITIMVLELKVPHGDDLESLKPLWPVFVSYVLSFVHVGIYWNNHHHLMQAVHKVSGPVLWHNLHLLFCLSLVPFATGWMGENHFGTVPVAVYGSVLLLAGVAYFFLTRCLANLHGRDSAFSTAIGRDRKGLLSVIIYFAGIVFSLFDWWLGLAMYALVAIIWFVPDKRLEGKVE